MNELYCLSFLSTRRVFPLFLRARTRTGTDKAVHSTCTSDRCLCPCRLTSSISERLRKRIADATGARRQRAVHADGDSERKIEQRPMPRDERACSAFNAQNEKKRSSNQRRNGRLGELARGALVRALDGKTRQHPWARRRHDWMAHAAPVGLRRQVSFGCPAAGIIARSSPSSRRSGSRPSPVQQADVRYADHTNSARAALFADWSI